MAAPPLASFRKIHGLPISKTVRTADSTIIIITNFYLAASSHKIFSTVGGIEGMKGLGALQRHQLPHPPCKNPGSATVGVNSLPKTVTRQRRDCDLNPGPSAPESSTLTTRLPSYPGNTKVNKHINNNRTRNSAALDVRMD